MFAYFSRDYSPHRDPTPNHTGLHALLPILHGHSEPPPSPLNSLCAPLIVLETPQISSFL